jgi:hypothetical protein
VLYGIECFVLSLQQQSTARVVLKDRSTGVSRTLWRFDYELGPFGTVTVGWMSVDRAGTAGAWVIAKGTGPTTSDFFGFHWRGSNPPLQLHTGDDVPAVAISPDGRQVAYQSGAARFGQIADIAVYDVLTAQRFWVSVDTNGVNDADTPNASSFDPSWSGDGALIAFDSAASDLVPNDLNGVSDGFVRPLSNVLSGTALQTVVATGT